MSDLHEGPFDGQLPDMGAIVETRLAGDGQAGISEVWQSPQEAFALEAARASVNEARAERTRQRANGDFLVDFAGMLPGYTYEGRGVVHVGDLDTVKRVQSSVLWVPLEGAGYVVGAKPSDKPKFTELLLAHPTDYDGKRELYFTLGRVYAEDYRQWKDVAPAIRLAEYTYEQIQALADHQKGDFVATDEDPHSMHMRSSGLAEPKGLADRVLAVSIRQARPNFMIKSDVQRWGVRMRRDFDFKRIDPHTLSDTDMELLGVFDAVSGIAKVFGKGDELKRLCETWQTRHGELVL